MSRVARPLKVATGSLTLVQEFDEKDDYDLG